MEGSSQGRTLAEQSKREPGMALGPRGFPGSCSLDCFLLVGWVWLKKGCWGSEAPGSPDERVCGRGSLLKCWGGAWERGKEHEGTVGARDCPHKEDAWEKDGWAPSCLRKRRRWCRAGWKGLCIPSWVGRGSRSWKRGSRFPQCSSAAA